MPHTYLQVRSPFPRRLWEMWWGHSGFGGLPATTGIKSGLSHVTRSCDPCGTHKKRHVKGKLFFLFKSTEPIQPSLSDWWRLLSKIKTRSVVRNLLLIFFFPQNLYPNNLNCAKSSNTAKSISENHLGCGCKHWRLTVSHRSRSAWQSSRLSRHCLLFNHRTQHLLEIELYTAQLQAIFI